MALTLLLRHHRSRAIKRVAVGLCRCSQVDNQVQNNVVVIVSVDTITLRRDRMKPRLETPRVMILVRRIWSNIQLCEPSNRGRCSRMCTVYRARATSRLVQGSFQ